MGSPQAQTLHSEQGALVHTPARRCRGPCCWSKQYCYQIHILVSKKQEFPGNERRRGLWWSRSSCSLLLWWSAMMWGGGQEGKTFSRREQLKFWASGPHSSLPRVLLCSSSRDYSRRFEKYVFILIWVCPPKTNSRHPQKKTGIQRISHASETGGKQFQKAPNCHLCHKNWLSNWSLPISIKNNLLSLAWKVYWGVWICHCFQIFVSCTQLLSVCSRYLVIFFLPEWEVLCKSLTLQPSMRNSLFFQNHSMIGICPAYLILFAIGTFSQGRSILSMCGPWVAWVLKTILLRALLQHPSTYGLVSLTENSPACFPIFIAYKPNVTASSYP